MTKRTIFVRIDKTENVLKAYDHYLNTSDIIGGKTVNFWNEVVSFEKAQGNRIKIQARTLLFELPLEWKQIPERQLKKRCTKLLRKIFYNCIGYTYFIRTATNNERNFHMIVLFSERMAAELFVYESRDQYRCSRTGQIVSKESQSAVKIVSKGDIKKGADGKAVVNTAAFGIKNAKYKTREWLYEVKKITLKHFCLYKAGYLLDSMSQFNQIRYSGWSNRVKRFLRSFNYMIVKISEYIKKNPKSKKAKTIVLTIEEFLKEKRLKESIKYIDYVLYKKEVTSS